LKKTDFIIVILLCAFGIGMVYSADIQSDLANNLLRMHIIANSDNKKDQDIKIKVRNETLKADTYNLEEIEKVANSVLEQEKAGYNATAKYEIAYVPQKEYKNVALPEGYYNCLNITLGRGLGHNWWCIAYPPLCFTEEVFGDLSEAAKATLNSKLTRKSIETIIKNGDVNFKFKSVEEFQKFLKILSK